MLQRAGDLIDFVVWRDSVNLYMPVCYPKHKQTEPNGNYSNANSLRIYKSSWICLGQAGMFHLIFLDYSWIAWLFFRWLYRFNANTVSMATYQVWKGDFPPPHTLIPGIDHGDMICDVSYSSVAAVKTIWLDGFHFCHHYQPIWSPATAFT